MGLKEFQIHVDNPWATYYTGQTISGQVSIVLDKQKSIRGVLLKIKGEANTCWSVENRKLNNEGHYEDQTQTVSAHEEYFNSQYYLVGSKSGSQIDLSSGINNYPFTFALPKNLPSSFESDYGYVRYTIRAVIDRPWKFDHEVIKAVTVLSHYDLNEEHNASVPIQEEMSKTFCCLCCGSPPLTVNYSLPVRGYVSGQTMPVSINVDNQSGIVVDKIKLILLKTVTYVAKVPQSETKIEEFTVSEVSKGPIQGIETTDYVQQLEIPSMPPSLLKYCGIIDVVYDLKIEACISGWYHSNLSKKSGIYIGTIPIMNYQMPEAPSPSAPTLDNMATGDTSPTAPNILYPTLPPPTYEEATNGYARSLRKANEPTNIIGITDPFTPRYPVYNFTPQK